MKPLAVWVVGFVLGAGDALLKGLLGVGAGAIFFVLSVLAVRRERAAALSGLLLGFGSTWPAGLARQTMTRGRLEDPAPWLALGIVSLALGLLAALVRIARHGRTTVGM